MPEPPIAYETEKALINAWSRSGGEDRTSLLVLADWIAEHTNRLAFERVLRRAAAASTNCFPFAYTTAFNSQYETYAHGILRRAQISAEAHEALLADSERGTVRIIWQAQHFGLWNLSIQRMALYAPNTWHDVARMYDISIAPGSHPRFDDAGVDLAPKNVSSAATESEANLARKIYPIAPELEAETSGYVIEKTVFRHRFGSVWALLPERPPLSGGENGNLCVAFRIDSGNWAREVVADYKSFIRSSSAATFSHDPSIESLAASMYEDFLVGIERVSRSPVGARATRLARMAQLRKNRTAEGGDAA